MGVGAERPRTRGGTFQKLGRNDRVWGGRGADRPGADRLWGGSTGTPPKTVVAAYIRFMSVLFSSRHQLITTSGLRPPY